jgi:Zn-dependent protease with chaperone function
MKKNLISLSLLLLLIPLSVLAAVSVPNPLPNVNNVPTLVNNIIKGFLGVSGALALFFVFQGGITWMMSRGNADKVKSGKDMIVWAIFGLVAIFLSYAIINIVLVSLQGVQ